MFVARRWRRQLYLGHGGSRTLPDVSDAGCGQPVHGERMSYYIGFRQGWVKLLGHGMGWYDTKLYPHSIGRALFGWKVWVQ